MLCVQVELIVGDIKESVSRVSDVHFIAEDNMTVPSITYEVRDGACVRVCVLGGGYTYAWGGGIAEDNMRPPSITYEVRMRWLSKVALAGAGAGGVLIDVCAFETCVGGGVLDCRGRHDSSVLRCDPDNGSNSNDGWCAERW